MVYNKQVWKDEIPDMTKPIKDASGKQKADPQTGRPLFELVQEGTRITSARLNHVEEGIAAAHEQADQNAVDIDSHEKDAVRHITAAERTDWKAKETPAGAQAKADAALSSAKTYADTALLAKADKSSTYSKTETDQRIKSVVGAAPDALDTLKEIGDALNNDPNFAATVTNQLSGKVDKVASKQLSTENYSTAEKAKLAGITAGAGGAGSATDAVIGNRTATDTATPSLTGTLTALLSSLFTLIKGVTGKSSVLTAPAITLETTKAHVDNGNLHTTAGEKTKLAGIAAGAEVNQNAFATVNNIPAVAKSDTLTVTGGTGITVTTNPTTRTMFVTATGTATPGAHGSSHNIDGSDPIPDLVSVKAKVEALEDFLAYMPIDGGGFDTPPGGPVIDGGMI
ncbi:hypothetical protein [Paenibacillus donghaensis]|uniref:Uncharacterized protein n=1 Tax=Paenibacillus donghaensis TaxID=414771 RepID=A0A2Z2K989_9BACL|nr:hypothetical protein [Paenibacillus donghaensis]ASA21947.1 hypothetical protein B9T62_14880 [Paenibacillus donghaensis]